MSVYLTEAEQIELIKTLWRRYGNLVTWLLTLVLLMISANKYWHWHQDKIMQQASETYERLMVSVAQKSDKSILAYAHTLATVYKNTVYATAAQLILVKQYIDHKNYIAAKNSLQQIIAQKSQNALVDIAKIRLARILIAEHAYQKAIDILSKMSMQIYGPKINELLGDSYLSLHKLALAQHAYQQAILQCKQRNLNHVLIDYKLQSVYFYGSDV